MRYYNSTLNTTLTQWKYQLKKKKQIEKILIWKKLDLKLYGLYIQQKFEFAVKNQRINKVSKS